MADTWSTEIRWFDPVGKCRCGKPANGVLRGPRNESYGAACARCATAAIIYADRHRVTAPKPDRTGETE